MPKDYWLEESDAQICIFALFIANAVTAHTPVLDMKTKSVSAPYEIEALTCPPRLPHS